MIFNRLELRPATFEDADFLLELKNDPIMRKFAVVSHKKIKKQDHLDWLFDNIGGIFIITQRGWKMGMFRIADGEVSINLHPSTRGQGIGSKVLRKFCPKGVWAKIVDGNVASMRIFLKNGFEIVDHKDNYYILEK